MKTDGHITEDVYSVRGFVLDTNYTGDIINKPDAISNKMRHRAKILR